MRRTRAILVAFGMSASTAWGQFAPPPPSTPPLAHPGVGAAPTPISSPAPVSQYPLTATVMVQQVEAYSGPAGTYYPTSRLKYGERIVVLGESKKAPGWLEVMPPPGSFSWIEAKYVKVVPGMEKIGIVDTGEAKGSAPVMTGSALVNTPPNVEIARVATGSQVFLLDRSTSTGGAQWYPIAPVTSEVRFLPADAVRGGMYAGGGNPYQTPTIPASWQQPGGSNWQAPAGPAANPYAFVQTSQQADQALAAGNIDRARILYMDALRNTTDPAWQNYLNGQLAKLSAAPASPPLGQPYQAASNPPSGPWTGATAPPPAASPKQWSPWGVLRSAPFPGRDGQPIYVLEDRQSAKPVMYVTTAPGTSLRDYLNQTVALYGSTSARTDEFINLQMLIAEQVATPPAGAK